MSNSLYLGSIGTGKTKDIKKEIHEWAARGQKVLILDFNNDYKGVSEKSLFLDKVNPTLGQVSLWDAKAMNAGYLQHSVCLSNKSEEVLKENGVLKKEGLIEEAVERLHISWENAENMYGKMLSQKMPLKRNRSHVDPEHIIEDILKHQVCSLKSKNMHSDHLRGVVFLILSKLSRVLTEPIHIVCDDLTSMFGKGNTTLFFSTLDLTHMNFIFAFNKVSSVHPDILERTQQFYFYRFNNPAEIKQLSELKFDIQENLQTLEIGKRISFQREAVVFP